MNEKEEALQLWEVRKTTRTKGWDFIVLLWNEQREQILKELKQVNKEGNKDKTMVYAARLDGFDSVVGIVDRLIKRFEELEEADSQRKKEQADDEGR